MTARDIAVLPTDQLEDYAPVKKLGPDALEIAADEFAGNALMTRGSVKDALLDQKVVAGIGNAYADEILFEARLSPFVKVKDAGEDGVDQV